MKTKIIATLKSKWTYIALAAVAGMVSGGVYNEMLTKIILSLLGQ